MQSACTQAEFKLTTSMQALKVDLAQKYWLDIIFLLTGLRIYTGEYKAQGQT